MDIALVFVSSLVVGFFTPWWSAAIIAFAVALWRSDSAAKAFCTGLAGIALSWLALALYIHFSSGGILTARIAAMLSVPVPVVFLATALIGGAIGGMAALSGFYCRGLKTR